METPRENTREDDETGQELFGGKRGRGRVNVPGQKWYGSCVENALAGTASLRQAVKAKCIDCSCEQKEEITDCRVRACPLWRYRPYQKRAEELSE